MTTPRSGARVPTAKRPVSRINAAARSIPLEAAPPTNALDFSTLDPAPPPPPDTPPELRYAAPAARSLAQALAEALAPDVDSLTEREAKKARSLARQAELRRAKRLGLPPPPLPPKPTRWDRTLARATADPADGEAGDGGQVGAPSSEETIHYSPPSTGEPSPGGGGEGANGARRPTAKVTGRLAHLRWCSQTCSRVWRTDVTAGMRARTAAACALAYVSGRSWDLTVSLTLEQADELAARGPDWVRAAWRTWRQLRSRMTGVGDVAFPRRDGEPGAITGQTVRCQSYRFSRWARKGGLAPAG